MEKITLSDKIFHDEELAREYLEYIRWCGKPVCPHCGNDEKSYRITGKSVRQGLWKCAKCRKQYSVTVGTLFEGSHIPIPKWLQATFLICSSKKGISSHQLHRMMDVTYKTAWFMSHRIRAAMKAPFFLKKMGGKNKILEADETYWCNTKKLRKGARGYAHKEKIFALVERGGDVRSFHVEKVTGATLKPIIRERV